MLDDRCNVSFAANIDYDVSFSVKWNVNLDCDVLLYCDVVIDYCNV